MDDDHDHYRASEHSWLDDSWDGALDEVIFECGTEQSVTVRELWVMCNLDWDRDGQEVLINSVTLVRVKLGLLALNQRQIDRMFGIGTWREIEAEAERAALRYHGQEV